MKQLTYVFKNFLWTFFRKDLISHHHFKMFKQQIFEFRMLSSNYESLKLHFFIVKVEAPELIF